MHILHVYKDYAPVVGGIEGHVQALAERQVRRGHTVTVLVTNPGGQPAVEQRNGVRILRARRLLTVASTPLSLDLPRQLRRLQPDITHLHFPYPVGEVAQWLFGRGRPFVITYHSDVVKQQGLLRLYAPFLRRVLAAAAQIMPTSPPYLESSLWLRPLRARCTPVPLGIDPAPFLAAPSVPRAALPTVLFVGVHRHYKGVDDLLRALVDLPARALIAGDGPLRADWEALARALGLGERAQFLGCVEPAQLPALYRSADIFALPSTSRAEAFGIVLMEAMAAGLPCVTTEVGTGTSWLVQDGVTGLVAPPRRPDLLAQALGRLLADPDLRRAMGAAGQARVTAEFTLDRLAERVEAVYQAALG